MKFIKILFILLLSLNIHSLVSTPEPGMIVDVVGKMERRDVEGFRALLDKITVGRILKISSLPGYRYIVNAFGTMPVKSIDMGIVRAFVEYGGNINDISEELNNQSEHARHVLGRYPAKCAEAVKLYQEALLKINRFGTEYSKYIEYKREFSQRAYNECMNRLRIPPLCRLTLHTMGELTFEEYEQIEKEYQERLFRKFRAVFERLDNKAKRERERLASERASEENREELERRYPGLFKKFRAAFQRLDDKAKRERERLAIEKASQKNREELERRYPGLFKKFRAAFERLENRG